VFAEDAVEADEEVVLDLEGFANDFESPIRLVVNHDAVPVFGTEAPLPFAGEVGVVTRLGAVDFTCPGPCVCV
jgi:hypothetical protein